MCYGLASQCAVPGPLLFNNIVVDTTVKLPRNRLHLTITARPTSPSPPLGPLILDGNWTVRVVTAGLINVKKGKVVTLVRP